MYSGPANLKRCRDRKWRWLTRFRSDRLVGPDRAGPRPVSDCDVAATDGTAEHWATDDPATDDLERLRLAEASWRIEEYHRGLKQVTNVDRCQCRVGRAHRGYIGLALRAFVVVVERWRFRTGVNWLTAEWQITREAVRAYRANPVYRTAPA